MDYTDDTPRRNDVYMTCGACEDKFSIGDNPARKAGMVIICPECGFSMRLSGGPVPLGRLLEGPYPDPRVKH